MKWLPGSSRIFSHRAGKVCEEMAGFREYLCFGEKVVLPKYREAV